MQKTQNYFLLLLLLILGVLSFFILKPYLSSIFLAGALAIVFSPVYKKILSVVKFDGFASLISTIFVLLVVLIPLGFFGTLIFNESINLYNAVALSDFNLLGLKDIASSFKINLSKLIPSQYLSLDLGNYLKQALEWLVVNIGEMFSGITRGIFSFIISIFILFYIFKDGSGLKKYLIEHSPLPDSQDIEIFQRVKNSILSVVKGSLFIAIIQGIITAIGFLIFGVPNPALWGGVAALAALIPNFGTSLVIIPAIIYLFLSGSTFSSVGLLIWGVVAVGLVDNFLGPKLMSRGAKIHPILIFLGVIGGVSFLGPIGFIAGPLIFALLFEIIDIYSLLNKRDN